MATAADNREAWTQSRTSGYTADSGVDFNSDSESGDIADKKVTFPATNSQWYGKLCSLMVEGSLIALRERFNQVYPPITLAEQLTSANMRKKMEALYACGVFDERQWRRLYPKNKKRINSENYDLMLLSILLRRVCHLSPPYPNGWSTMPNDLDHSISAEIARLHVYRARLLRKAEKTDDEAKEFWSMLLGTLMELAGDKCLLKADKIHREDMTEETQQVWVTRLQTWHEKEVEASLGKPKRRRPDSAMSDASGDLLTPNRGTRRRSRMSLASPQRASSARIRRTKLQVIDGGLPKEERATLQKFYKSLVTNVKVTDIIEQLTKSEILTYDEQSAIYCNEKNRQRMDALITILYTKPAKAYEDFIKSIKFKHSHLYEMMCKNYQGLKREASNCKPDNLRQTSEILRSHNRLLCTRWKPIPWVDNVHASLRDFYVKQSIISSHGDTMELQEIFNIEDPKARSIIMIGESGSGKTTLCKRLIYDWLADNRFLHNLYQLVFYVDMNRMTGSLKDYLYGQLSEHLSLGKDEFWKVITIHQHDILFILDDYDPRRNGGNEIEQIITKTILPNASVLMTATSPPPFYGYFHSRLVLLGLVRRNIMDLVRLYTELSGGMLEQVNTLFQALQRDTLRELAVKPFFCLCLCTLATMNGADLSSITTETILLEQFVNAIKTKHSGNTRETRTLGSKTLKQLQEAATHASMAHTKILSCDKLKNEFDNNFMYTFGLLYSLEGNTTCRYVCKALQDFLTALYLRDLAAIEFRQYCDRLVTDPWFQDVCRYVCGLRRSNKVTEPLRSLVQDLVSENLKHCKRIYWVRNKGGVTLGVSEARVMDLSLSLECVYEMIDRDDMNELIAKSLPEKLVVRTRGISFRNIILGLAKLIKLNKGGPRQLEVLFDKQTNREEKAMLELACAMHSNFQVTFLKVEWTSDQFFAQFLSTLFKQNIAIDCVKLVDLRNEEHTKPAPATVRADLQQACKNMKYVKKLTLSDCGAPMLVNSVIHGIPLTMESLDLTGCAFNPVCSEELSYQLEHSKALMTLNLTSVCLEGMCFRYIMKGLRTSQSLKELILRDTKIDKCGQAAIAEALKFNHKLQILDLSRTDLTTQGCIQLSQGLGFNKSLRQLILLGSWLESDQLDLLKAYKYRLLHIVEDSSRPPTARAAILAD